MKKIPILFTTFNRLGKTKKSLPALLENSKDIAEVFIVDNNSVDGTQEYLRGLDDPIIKAKIFNRKNIGVAGAMNQFFEQIGSTYKYFAKVDNDTLVSKNWLENMLAVIETEDVDFIQAKHYFMVDDMRDWDDLLSKCDSKSVFGNNLIYTKYIGGSGIIGKCSKILGRLDETGNKLVGWSNYLKDNEQLKCAFYDGVEIDLLDTENYNKLKVDDLEYHIQTGRISIKHMPKVSIIIPIIRPEGAKKCIEAIKKNAVVSEEKYEIVTAFDDDRIGCPKMVRELVKRTKHDFVMFLADDTVPKYGFIVRAFCAMDKLPGGWGLVGLNDNYRSGKNNATHWLASKKLLDHLEDNDFFYTGYRHQFCDRELTDIAIELDRYIWAEDAEIIHNHPAIDMKFEDEDYMRVYSDENQNHDHKLYINRKKAKGYWKLGIGFPLTDARVYAGFFTSWTLMHKPDFTLLMPMAPGHITAIRNNLVVQALEECCTHLLMMDTDQVYQIDTIPKLLSHEKDVVGVSVHRRYPPFDSIMYRGELGNYHHVPDEDCFSGKLIEVDATGCGCILCNTDVFFDIPYPWFKEYKRSDGRVVGEDIDFCSKLKASGHEIYIDTSIEIGHLTTMEVTRSFYKLYKKLKGFEWRPPPDEQNQLDVKI